jgi:hypothetical protein
MMKFLGRLPLRAERLPWLLIAAYALLSAAWVFGNPPGAAPDEPSHYLKALAAGRGQWLGRPVSPLPDWQPPPPYDRPEAKTNPAQRQWLQQTTRAVDVPSALAPGAFACNAFRPDASAACLGTPAAASVETSVAEYPPFLYALPGLLMRTAQDAPRALLLGRLVSAALSLGFLAGAVFVLWSARAPALSLLGMLVAVTPMVLFLTSGISANGAEIASGLCFFAALLRLTRAPSAPPAVWVALIASVAVLILSRQLGPLWVVLGGVLFVSALGARAGWARVWRGGRTARLVLPAVGAAIALSVVWELAVRAASPMQVARLPSDLAGTLGELRWLVPALVQQGMGIFGWLDADMPFAGYLVWTAMVLMLLGAAFRVGSRHDRWTLVTMIAAGLLLTVAVSALLMRPIGFRPQARQLLPVAVALPLVAGEVLFRQGPRFPSLRLGNLVFFFALLGGAVNGLGWYANAHRHAVGVSGPWLFLGQAQWSPPLGWFPWLLAVALGSLALVAFGTAAWCLSVAPAGLQAAHRRAA